MSKRVLDAVVSVGAMPSRRVSDSRTTKTSRVKTQKDSEYESILRDLFEGSYDDDLIWMLERFLGKRWKEFDEQVRRNHDIPDDYEIDEYLSEEDLTPEIVNFLVDKNLSKKFIQSQMSEYDPSTWKSELSPYISSIGIEELAKKLREGLKEIGDWNSFASYCRGKGEDPSKVNSQKFVDLFTRYPQPDIKWSALDFVPKSEDRSKVKDSRTSGRAPKSSPSKTAKNSDYDSMLKDLLDGDFDDTIVFLFEDFIGKRWKEFDEQVRKNHPEVPNDVEIDEYLGEDVLVPEIVDFLIAKNLSGRFIKSKLSEYDPVTWKSELNSYMGDMSIDELAKKLKSGLKELETWDDFVTYFKGRGDDPDKVNSRKFIELFTRYPQPDIKWSVLDLI